MTAFLEDPRLRRRWNQLSHNAETVTENAAAGIWTFQHAYVSPCLASISEAVDSCTSVCLGDREDRARRQRERARGAHRSRAEYSFDFYDDWYDDFEGDGLDPAAGDLDGERGGGSGAGTLSSIFGRGFFGSWQGSRSEDWDRLLAGSGAKRSRYHGTDEDRRANADGSAERNTTSGDDTSGGNGEVVEQPRRGRGMSYSKNSKRALRRKFSQGEDPTVIPSTAPLGFLERLPWKIGGTLRYKPSAANLREHPIRGGADGGTGGSSLQSIIAGRRTADSANALRERDENEPLLGPREESDEHDDGGQDDLRTDSGKRQLAAADATRRYGTAMPSVPVVDISAVSAGSTQQQDGIVAARARSGTTGSGGTTDSFRSRGDLFPSDEEDDEDAVPLDDEFAAALNRGDDRSSARTRFSSSSSLAAGLDHRKGKKRADTSASTVSIASAGSGASGPVPLRGVLSRSVSRTTIDSFAAQLTPSLRSPPPSIKKRVSSLSLPLSDGFDSKVVEEAAEGGADFDTASGEVVQAATLSAEQLREEDERAAREEDEAIAQRREAAALLARERGLAEPDDAVHQMADADGPPDDTTSSEPLRPGKTVVDSSMETTPAPSPTLLDLPQKEHKVEFVPARLPRFA
ncbi:hypothetical protein SEPCBS119000_002600 [Sporothrix epigloea]|uniref:Uncharacterized protein n=1 Tax=Sporothrix epigloea TaxID=1892477 RepID=A0ABP0DH10_9PEZI